MMITLNMKFVSSTELKRMGYTYYKIARLVEQGKLKKATKSQYENLMSEELERIFKEETSSP
jgi:hypothetical protein